MLVVGILRPVVAEIHLTHGRLYCFRHSPHCEGLLMPPVASVKVDANLHLIDNPLTFTFHLMRPDISIVIPAFEEEARVGDSIAKILDFVSAKGMRAELIVVDDGSKDRTAET